MAKKFEGPPVPEMPGGKLIETRTTPELPTEEKIKSDFNKVNADLSIFVHDLARLQVANPDPELVYKGFDYLKSMLATYGKIIERAEKQELEGIPELEEKRKEKERAEKTLDEVLNEVLDKLDEALGAILPAEFEAGPPAFHREEEERENEAWRAAGSFLERINRRFRVLKYHTYIGGGYGDPDEGLFSGYSKWKISREELGKKLKNYIVESKLAYWY